MNKLNFIIILFSLTFIFSNISFAETKDCSQYSTKTFAGLNDYLRCKKGLKPLEKNIFKSLKWKKKQSAELDPSIPCDEYSTKTMSGLAKKLKCKRNKKNNDN